MCPMMLTHLRKPFPFYDKEALRTLESSNGIDLEQTFRGESLLHIAAGSNCTDVISFLLDKGVDANKLSKLTSPQVALANVSDINSESFKLLSKYTDPLIVENIKSSIAMQHFSNAVDIINRNGSIAEFAEAIQSIDIDFTDDGGWSLLHYAADQNNLCIAEFLLKQGANANIKDVEFFTPLQYVRINDSSMYKLLYNKTDKPVLEIELAPEVTEFTNDVSPLLPIYEPEDEPLEVDNNIESPKRIYSQPQNATTPAIMDISMHVLGGFMAALGCAAVATAFIFLNAATLGITGLVVASLGTASILAGIGLFGMGTYNNRQTIPNESLDDIAALSF